MTTLVALTSGIALESADGDYGDHMGDGWWGWSGMMGWGSIGAVLAWALLALMTVAIVATVVIALRPGAPSQDPRATADNRLARGEITIDEHNKIIAQLNRRSGRAKPRT